MSRIETKLEELAQAKKKALIAYLCMGYPDEDTSVQAALQAVAAGADILELGVPFSDPTADGPVIARASYRALQKGGGLEASLRAATRIRRETNAPIVLFGYYNPLFVFGENALVERARDAGIDALLVVDLPVEESTPLRQLAGQHGMAVVPILAPTSSDARLSKVRETAKSFPCGFVYYVSVAGVTGAASIPAAEASRKAGEVHAKVGLPTVVGFGIDSPEKAKEAAHHCQGVVVGSALIRLLDEAPSPSEGVQRVGALLTAMRKSLDSGT